MIHPRCNFNITPFDFVILVGSSAESVHRCQIFGTSLVPRLFLFLILFVLAFIYFYVFLSSTLCCVTWSERAFNSLLVASFIPVSNTLIKFISSNIHLFVFEVICFYIAFVLYAEVMAVLFLGYCSNYSFAFPAFICFLGLFNGCFSYIYLSTRRFVLVSLATNTIVACKDVTEDRSRSVIEYIPHSNSRIDELAENYENKNQKYKNLQNIKNQNKKNKSVAFSNPQSSLERVKGYGGAYLSAGTESVVTPTGHGCLFDHIEAHIRSLPIEKFKGNTSRRFSPRNFLADLDMTYGCYVSNIPEGINVAAITPTTPLVEFGFGPMLPTWLANANLASLLVILRSLERHELSDSPSHPYTKIRSEYVRYSISNYAVSLHDLCGALALINNLCPSGVSVVNFDSVDRFPLDTTLNFVRDRDIHLTYEDVDQLKGDCYFGELNAMNALLSEEHKCVAFNRARWSGIITSLVQQGKNNKEISSVIMENYPTLQRSVKYVPPNKRHPEPTFDVKCGRNGLWFLSLLPRCAFYLEHDGDFINVYNVWKSLVARLIQRMIDAAHIYADIARMSPSERKDALKARSTAFADELRKPDCQAMFASGLSRAEVVDYVIKNKRKQIINNKSSKEAIHGIRQNHKVVKDKGIKQARSHKMEAIYNDYTPHSITEYVTSVGNSMRQAYDTYGVPWFMRYAMPYIVVPCLSFFFVFVYIYERSLGPLVSYVTRFMGRVDIVEQSINTWMSSFKNVFTLGTDKAMMVHLLEIKTICHILFELYAGTKRGALAWASNLVITRGSSVYVLLNTISEQTFGGVQTHAGNDQVITSVCSILSAHGIQNISDEDLKRFNTEMTAARFRSQNARNYYVVAVAIVQQLCLLLFGYDPMSPMQTSFANRCLEVIIKTRAYMQEKPKKREEMLVLINLYEQNKNNEQNSMFETLPTYIKSVYARYFRELEDLASEARNSLIGDEDRCEPVVVLFCGAPKSGKTNAMHTVRALLAKHYYDGKKDTYSVNGYSQYFEGYRNQPFVIMDDQFVNSDPALRAEEIQKFIGMVNTTPYSLNMAFGDKGKTFFNSDFVFVTTNAIGTNKKFDAAVSDEGAFFRRMHIVAERNAPMSTDPTSDLFTIIKSVEEGWVGRRVNSVQLAKMCSILRDRFKERYARFREMRDNLHNINLSEVEYIPHSDTSPVTDDVVSPNRLARFPRQAVSSEVAEDLMVDSFYLLPDVEGKTDDPESGVKSNPLRFRNRKVDTYEIDQDNKDGVSDTDYKTPFYLNKALANQSELPSTRGGDDDVVPPIPANALTFIRNFFVAMSPKDGWWSENWVKYLVIIFLFLATTTFAVYFIFRMNSAADGEYDGQSSSNFRKSGAKRKQDRKNRRKVVDAQHKRMRSKDANASKTYTGTSGKTPDVSHVHGCTVVFVARGLQPSSGRWIKTTCIATHISDGVFIFPYHWHWDFMTPGDEWLHTTFNMEMRGGVSPFKYDMENIVTYENLDMLSIFIDGLRDKLPGQALKYAPDAAVIDNLPEDAIVSLVLSSGRKDFTGTLLNSSGPVRFNSGPLQLVVDYPLFYNIFSEKGDSGAPVVWVAPNNKRYIIGMHVGLVNNSSGVCVPLDEDSLKHIVSVTKPPAAYESTSCVTELPLPVLRYVDRPAHLPRESKIKRAPLYGYAGPATTAPARLKPFMREGSIIDPVALSMRKLASREVRFQWLDDEQTRNEMIDYLFTHYPAHDSRLLTWEECANGVPEWAYPSIDGTTSAGYPYCLDTNKGKAPYITFSNSEQKHIVSDELLDRVQHCEHALSMGEPIEFLWMDVLKDETRPLDKVEEGKTRLIATCPVDFLLLMRKYFGSFIAYVHTKCVTGPVAVGINVHSAHWYFLYSRFSDKTHANGWSFLAGDFQNYDGKVPFQLGDIVVDFINRWYDDGPINAQIRKKLIQHVHHPCRVCENQVYQVFGGNVSGNPITSEYNSLIQTLMWFVLAKRYDVPRDGLEMSFYGDDSLVAIRATGITTNVVARLFDEMFDMTYTHSSKASFDGVDTIDTATYLGRRFVPADFAGTLAPVVLAPLSVTVIREILYFHKSSVNTFHENYAQSIRSFVIEMSHHSPTIFREEIRKVERAIKREMPNDTTREFLLKLLGQYSYDMLITARYREQTIDHTGRICFQERSYFVPNSSSGSAYRVDEANQNCGVSGSLSSNSLWYDGHTEKVYVDLHTSCRDFNPVTNTTTTTDNTQYTDRAANAPVPTQTVELGLYHDTAPIVSTAINSELIQAPYRNINMETFDLSEVLKREYELSSFTWSSVSPTNTYVASYNFPEDLLAQPFIADKIRGFRNFVTGIRVSFRMSSNTFNYGRLMVVYRPDVGDDVFYTRRATTIEQISGFPHIIVSASSSEVGVFDIPFVLNRRALDRSATSDPQALGTLSVIVLNPLTNTYGVASNVTVFVTAQFVDFKMYVPYAPTSGMEESIDKSKNNIISGVLEKTADIASMVKSVPFVSGYASAYEGTARILAAGAKMIGLDKPTSLARTNIDKVNPYSDIANSRGIDCSNKLAVDPENKISTYPNVAGQTVDEMDINYICGTPTLASVFSVGTSTAVGANIKVCDTDVVRNNWTYAGWISDLCGYHSGSCKVKLYISASTMHACRVIFYINTVATKWQDCYHKVVDILGDTEVEMTLPYTSSYLVRTNLSDTTIDDPTMSLWMRVVSYSQPQTAVNTPIYFNVYLASASDFKVYMPLDRIAAVTGMPTTLKADATEYEPHSNPRVDFSKPFEPIHPSVRGFEHDGLIMGEQIRSYRDFVHRYCPIRAIDPLADTSVYEGRGNFGPYGYLGLEMYGLIYQFWRGSIRFKLMQFNNDLNSVAVMHEPMGVAVSGTTLSSGVNPLLEFEVPFYSPVMFRHTGDEAPLNLRGSGVHDMYLLKAGGDDFSFHFLCPPPTYNVPFNNNCGITGLAAFLTNNQP